MSNEELIGRRVQNRTNNWIGTVESIEGNVIEIDFHGTCTKYAFPQIFTDTLVFEDEDIQAEFESLGLESSFEDLKDQFGRSIQEEIDFLKKGGGKKYRLIDGIRVSSKSGDYLYSFETDTDMRIPEGTTLKLWFPDRIVPGYVVSCEDFMIFVRAMEDLGPSVDNVEMTYEQWKLLEALMDRLQEMNPTEDSLAYEVACKGRRKITLWKRIKSGQEEAFNRSVDEGITFIWGPPGTGKTETLANIAIHYINDKKRVLMLSYSNVSVDGAVLRVASKMDSPEGRVVRYGYPRMQKLLEDGRLTSYQLVLSRNPELANEYRELVESKKKFKKNDPKRTEINKKINAIRLSLVQKEKELIHYASFIATTVSKATIDQDLYQQKFDVVIFDEASMAYVPQVVFAAGLAKEHFVCLGDFRQLPAIVQNNSDDRLTKDIFEHTGIVRAVDNGADHEWLVMLDVQHRMHRDIADFAGKMMYEGLLKTADDIIDARNSVAENAPCSKAAMSIVDLSRMYASCTKTMDGSRINLLSAFVAMRIAEKLIDKYEVGIITPYNAQSRLLMAMIRDATEKDERWSKVTCATVHQFQGSEKNIIIYDAVDSFRARFPGTLLTSLKNDTANRLFNVALTRAQGKFILVANIEYFKTKGISSKLMFEKCIEQIHSKRNVLLGESIINELESNTADSSLVDFGDSDYDSWNRYIESIRTAEKSICIDIPSSYFLKSEKGKSLLAVLEEKRSDGLNIKVRIREMTSEWSKDYVVADEFVFHPVTVIDKCKTWFGFVDEKAYFISEGSKIYTQYENYVGFVGQHTAKSIMAFVK